MVCILLWSSAVWVHDSQTYRKMDVTRDRISRILKLTATQQSLTQRDVGRGGAQRSLFKVRERDIVNQTKGYAEETFQTTDGVYYGLSRAHKYHPELSWCKEVKKPSDKVIEPRIES